MGNIISRIQPADLETARLDPEFYKEEYRHAAQRVNLFTPCLTLDSIRKEDIEIRRGIDMPIESDRQDAPRLVTIASFEEPGINFSGLKGIDEAQHRSFRGSQVLSGDLLVAMGGYAGRAAICPNNPPPANIGRHTARIVVDDSKTNKYFVWAFISCRVGRLQFQRQITGSVQAGINLGDLKKIPIPNPDPRAQAYIGDKVRQAERLRQRARECRQQIQSYFISLFSALPRAPASKYARVSVSALSSRLNAEYYQEKYTSIETCI